MHPYVHPTSLVLLLASGCTQLPELDFNKPPTAPAVSLSPTQPTTVDSLVYQIVVESTDPDGDDVEYIETWYMDGLELSGFSAVVGSSRTAKNQVWAIELAAFDGEWESEPTRAEVQIANSQPTLTAASLDPPLPMSTEDLVLTVGSADADSDPVEIGILWLRDGEPVSELDGETTVPASMTSSHEVWTVEVTTWDGEAFGEQFEASVSIDNTAPVLAGIALSPDDVDVTIPITATAEGREDADGHDVAVKWSWYINNTLTAEETTSNGRSQLIGATVRGDEVYVVGTPNDGWVDGEHATSPSLFVGNAPPSVDEVELSPTEVFEATTLSCVGTGGADPDGDVVEFEYTWDIDGRELRGGDTLVGSDFEKGDEIVCTITPVDGEDEGTPKSSDSVDVQNTSPVISDVELSDTEPDEHTTVTVTFSASDDDGDSLTYTYAWYVDGAAATPTGTTITGTHFDRGDDVYVDVTVYDGTAYSATTTSDTATVQNAAPTFSGASISPSNAKTDEQLSVSPSGFSDADGDPQSFEYQWSVGGAELSGETSILLDSSNFVKGDQVTCEVTPYDGYEYGTSKTTPTRTIQNSTPEAAATVLTGSTAEQCDEIQLDASGSSDADGDGLTFNWQLASKPGASKRSTSDIDDTSDESPWFIVDADGTFSFRVGVSDGSASQSDTTSVTVSDRSDNSDPVADAGDDQTASGIATCSTTSYGYHCDTCEGDTFDLDATGSYDDDGDPLTYKWSTTSSYASIDDDDAATTTVTVSDLLTGYGATEVTTVSIKLKVEDCADGSDEDYMIITFECEGV